MLIRRRTGLEGRWRTKAINHTKWDTSCRCGRLGYGHPTLSSAAPAPQSVSPTDAGYDCLALRENGAATEGFPHLVLENKASEKASHQILAAQQTVLFAMTITEVVRQIRCTLAPAMT